MDAIRKKMQSLKSETDHLYANIARYENETKEANDQVNRYECDIRDYGKKIQTYECDFDETNDKLTKTRLIGDEGEGPEDRRGGCQRPFASYHADGGGEQEGRN